MCVSHSCIGEVSSSRRVPSCIAAFSPALPPQGIGACSFAGRAACARRYWQLPSNTSYRKAPVTRRVAPAWIGTAGGGGSADGGAEEDSTPSFGGDGNEESSQPESEEKFGEGPPASESEGTTPPERDWEGSWSKFQQERSGGVFGLPDENPRESDLYERRTERLTSLWSNETGFLAGIGVIFLIALFYVYIFYTGGISSTPPVSTDVF